MRSGNSPNSRIFLAERGWINYNTAPAKKEFGMYISSEVKNVFEEVTRSYPSELVWLIQNNRMRLLWQIQKVVDLTPAGGKIVDIGGGIVPFMYPLQLLGYETFLIDDFSDSMYATSESEQVLHTIQKSGTTVIDGDVLELDLGLLPDQLAVVTSHDSMEHWHNSPKTLFKSLWAKMTPGGVFWIGVPNAVNLRKRLTVPFGRGKWSSMNDWYEAEIFRGHVREPDVGDLQYIAEDLGAERHLIAGKNWLGYRNNRAIIRALTPYFDKAMQLRPSICSDIYLFAWKAN